MTVEKSEIQNAKLLLQELLSLIAVWFFTPVMPDLHYNPVKSLKFDNL